VHAVKTFDITRKSAGDRRPISLANWRGDWSISCSRPSRTRIVGTTYRWGVRLGRQGGGAGNFANSRCFINVEVMSRTGTSSPFDSNVRSLASDH